MNKVLRRVIYAFFLIIVSHHTYAQCGYDFSRTITIDNSQVSGSNHLTDFPVLVTLTLPDLATVANGGDVQNTNGYDIRFRASECDCWLDHQIENYNATTGAYTAWVRIPNLKYDEDTEIEMYYGNVTVATDPSTSNTWTSDYVGVWHLSEDPQGTGPQHTDASGTGNDGTAEGGGSIVNVNGVAGNGVSFDGNNDLIEVPDDNTLDLTTSLTLSLWFDLDGHSGSTPNYPTLLGKGQSWNTDNGYGLLAGDFSVPTAAGMIANPGRVIIADTGLPGFNDGNWHHMACTYDGTDFVFYFDGNQEATVSVNMSINTQGFPLHIGDGVDDGHWNGKIDEVRISNQPKSADWIATEFSNINDPSSFYSVGAQKQGDCRGPGGVETVDGNSNLVLWVKADCGVENASFETVSNGQQVTYWRDQSGYGHDASELSNRPDYETNQINGMPALNFDAGNGDRILSSGINDADEFMLFVVAEANSLASNNIGLIHASPGQGFSSSTSSKSIGIWVSNSANLWGRLIQSNGGTVNYSQATSLTLNNYYIIANYADGTSTTGQYISGTAASASVSYNGTIQGWTDVGIGRQGNESWDGHIAEVILFNRYLSEDERGQVEDYLAEKYGTSIPRVTGATGPGGVGSREGNSRLELWFDALDLDGNGDFEGLSESGLSGTTINTWVDRSGHGRDLSIGSASFTVTNSGMNNHPTADFNGTNQYLQSGNISIADGGALEYFIAFDDGGFNGMNNSLINWRNSGGGQGIGGFAAQGTTSNLRNWYYDGGFNNTPTGTGGSGGAFSTTAPYIYNVSYGSTGQFYYRNGTLLTSNGTGVTINNPSAPFALGRNIDTGGNYFSAEVGETIVFSAELNQAEKEIIEQYLSEKYNIALSGTDYYSGHTGDYIYEVQGIGTSDGTLENSHLVSNASSGLKIEMINGTFNASNEYAFTGYKETSDGVSSSDLGSLTAVQRLNRVWYLDATGTVDIRLTFDLDESVGDTGFPTGNDYVLLYSPSDPFAFEDWTADHGILPTVSESVISFTVTSADLIDGYYTLATNDIGGSPLPIELVFFKAKVCEKAVCLNWETATEINNEYFTIERSADGETWKEIVRMDGAGNSEETLSYSYQDQRPLKGVSYYRLKQTDFDGKFTYSSAEVVMYTHDSGIKIYPNPVSHSLFVESQNIDTYQIEFMNLSSRPVPLEGQLIGSDKLIFNMTQVPEGLYLIYIKFGGETIETRKILITK